MTYPNAPWQLRGYCLQTLHWIDIEKARPFVPAEFELVSLWPGKTLGGVYLSAYRAGSVLEYSELIVVPGLVRYAEDIGGWISHIYVDSADSVAGGREIWGLPKEMAEFDWRDRTVTVSQAGQLLCSLTYREDWFSFINNLPSQLTGTVFSRAAGQILKFEGDFGARSQLVSSQLTVAADSPFAALDLAQPWLTIYAQDLELTAHAPLVVGEPLAVAI
ncbi:MAG: acetoacetate decarboxylase family protein [Leptolyngbya sp. SIO4C1]|nr:acetoacetate decarboxylase family protein [Leptolyngbya sp. SIO4C1]